MSDDLVTWLRWQVETDLSVARMISDGGFEPQRWDTEPPGQVNPSTDPASVAISKAIGQEPEYSCGWVQIVVYEREIGDPPEEEYREPGSVAALAEIGRREFDHIIRHDPRSVVADCEMKLAWLAKHEGTHRCDYGDLFMPESFNWPCSDAKLLGSAYRHRAGYRDEWKP